MAGLDDVRRRIAVAYKAKDAAALQSAIRDYRAGQRALDQSKKNIAADEASYDPASGMSAGERRRAGIGVSGRNILSRATQLALPESVTPEFATDEGRKARESVEAPLMATSEGQQGKMIGDIGFTMAPSSAAGKLASGVLSKLPAAAAALKARGVAGALPAATKLPKYARYGQYAAEGAAGSALTEDDVGKGALMGVVGGRALEGLGSLARAGTRGLKRDPHADVLMEYGADLTPGQLNPSGTIARLEGAAASGPFGVGGQAIKEAQRAGVQPVVPNLISDLSGTGRQMGEDPLRAAQRSRERVGQLYAGAENLPLPPEELARLRSGREAQAGAMRGARKAGVAAGKLGQERVRTQATLAAEQAAEAVARAEKNPTPLNIAKAEDLVQKTRVLEQKVATLDKLAPAAAGREAARKKGDEFVPEVLKDLSSRLEGALSTHRIAKDSPIREHIMRLGHGVTRGRTTTQIKQALTSIRQKKHDLKYGRGATATDLEAARVYADVEEWFQKQLERAIKDPNVLRDVKAADEIYRDMGPLRESIFRTGYDPKKLIKGDVLEEEVQKYVSTGGYIEGLGGEPRRVAEALKVLEAGQQSGQGALQSRGLHRAVALLQSTVGGLGASKTVRRLAQGKAIPQEVAQKLEKTAAGRALKNSLKAIRPGVVGGIPESEDE